MVLSASIWLGRSLFSRNGKLGSDMPPIDSIVGSSNRVDRGPGERMRYRPNLPIYCFSNVSAQVLIVGPGGETAANQHASRRARATPRPYHVTARPDV